MSIKIKTINLYLILILFIITFYNTEGYSQTKELNVKDSGWRLLPDTAASWKNDNIYLPGDFDINKLPVNPPTGGWNVLNEKTGIEVKLPATVEEYYWGKFGYHPYKDSYWFENDDKEVKNGNYTGVSWWWTNIFIPSDFKGKVVILHIRGARLRVEIYLNKKLVGYNIINEVSYDCNISKAIEPGKNNLLAIRITNPGGEMGWEDFRTINWNNHIFQKSHGFGGLDRGITITAHDPIYITDMWTANTPQLNKIIAHTSIKNTSKENSKGIIRYELLNESNDKKVLYNFEKPFKVNGDSEIEISEDIKYANAKLWSINNPYLYTLRVTVLTRKDFQDKKEIKFGFRWFDVSGIDTNAVLRFNNKRIRLVSAISWGYWGYNGLFPTPNLAEKEVKDAKRLGLNCLQFHRNVGKEQVFESMDSLGLLRYMEPGGGAIALGTDYSLSTNSPKGIIDDSGKKGEAETFAEKYAQYKILRMIHDFRSHPSLIMYCIQNEISPDLRNPRIFYLIRKMHEADPSRIIILKSGISPVNQVWMKPYDTTVYYDHGSGFSGWFDEHTVGGPGVWQDDLYKNPKDFTHNSVNKKEIAAWGEMLGSGTPDNHSLMIKEIEANGGHSYDFLDHEQINKAYEKFLTKWDFRSAFRTTEDLFKDIGNKSYDFWGRVIETAKLSDENDYLVISGWESTAIDDHSALVDNLRNFKGNPDYISRRLRHLRPVVKARSLVIAKGKRAAVDLFLINETNKPAGKKLNFYIKDPSGRKTRIGVYSIPQFKKDKFVYPVADSILTPQLNEEGKYQISLQMDKRPDVISFDTLLVIDPSGPAKNINKRIGVFCDDMKFANSLSELLPKAQIEKYKKNGKYDLLIVSSNLKYGSAFQVDSSIKIKNTDEPELYRTESFGSPDNLEYDFNNLPRGKAEVTFKFAEIFHNQPGKRIINVAINGNTVIKNLDVYKTAGGKNIAFDTTITVDNDSGEIKITIPELTADWAAFNAIKIAAGDSIVAINCGARKPYTDKNGLVWKLYSSPVSINNLILKYVEKGTPLLALPEGENAYVKYAEELGRAGAFKYLGDVGNPRATWMGSWYFVRKFPVMEGLPVNQAMKSYYQVPAENSDGILLDGKGVDVFIGYSRGHDRNIGAAGLTAHLGKGKILFFSIPGLISGVNNKQTGIQPILAQRLITNSIKYLCSEGK